VFLGKKMAGSGVVKVLSSPNYMGEKRNWGAKPEKRSRAWRLEKGAAARGAKHCFPDERSGHRGREIETWSEKRSRRSRVAWSTRNYAKEAAEGETVRSCKECRIRGLADLNSWAGGTGPRGKGAAF